MSRRSYGHLTAALLISAICCIIVAPASSFNRAWSDISKRWKSNNIQQYNVRIFSASPNIIHLEHFITPKERVYLEKISRPHFIRSTIGVKGKQVASKFRTSSTAVLPLSDPIVERVAQRATLFQGIPYERNVEVQATKYESGQHFGPHLDYFPPRSGNISINRVSTIFAILEANCTDCGTRFLRVPVDKECIDRTWCEHVDCNKVGLTTRAVPGNAWYWRNLDRWGKGETSTLHEGIMVANGTKIGLNIWIRERLPPQEPVCFST